MIDHEFLKNWEPEVATHNGAGPSGICRECSNLCEDLVCEVRGFQMDMAPAVYACMEWSPKAKNEEPERQVEIHRTYTAEVTQILRVGASEAKAAEICMRGQDEKELERTAAASLGAENVKVRDLKVWVLD